jgi:ferredoxin-NAD(P)+ reductase (naphthalene dioxygenase ferredoxin-specific)
MPNIVFLPSRDSFDVEAETRILTAAKRNKVEIRFGCSAARCGTCAVRVTPTEAFQEMKQSERDLIQRMKLPEDGSIRLSCQARITSSCQVDIAFQDEYSPDVESE